MPLPKIDLPLFTITLPASKKKITCRPFVTREEKILQQASESEEPEQMVAAIQQVVNNCTVTELDVEKLPIIDLEYIFIKLRSNSVGEIIQARYYCQKKNESGKPCDMLVEVPVRISDLEPKMPIQDKSLIQVSPEMYIKLKYPTFEVMKELSKVSEDENDGDVSLKVIGKCIESVSKGDEVFDQFTLDEAVEFLQSLKRDVFYKVIEFFEDQPEIIVDVPFLCPKCGHKDTIVINGLEELSDFFD